MAKIIVWKCDICKREFRQDKSLFETNKPFSISIPAAYNHEKYQNFERSFDDTCGACRSSLIDSIMNLINE